MATHPRNETTNGGGEAGVSTLNIAWLRPDHTYTRTHPRVQRTSPRDGRVLSGGETLQYEPICMLLVNKLAPP